MTATKRTPTSWAWLAERGEYLLVVARDLLSREQRAETRAALCELTHLGPIPALPCHLDFMPRNMPVRPTGDVAVIDFEHARYELAARDLVRLATRIWPYRPDLKRGFLSGYGPIDELDHHMIRLCAHLDRRTAAIRAGSGSNSRQGR